VLPGTESSLLIWDMAKLVAEGAVKGVVWVARQGYDYAHKCHWWV